MSDHHTHDFRPMPTRNVQIWGAPQRLMREATQRFLTEYPRSSGGNPILADFRRHKRQRAERAWYWAKELTGGRPPEPWWLLGATVSEQVFAARVLYRYAAVFA